MSLSRLRSRANCAPLVLLVLWIGGPSAVAQTPPKPGIQTQPPVVAASPPPSIGKQVIEQQESAETQLHQAAKAQDSARGRKGPRRLQILHDAIAYYAAVSYWWPSAQAECAVAAFRRGEIHRALQESGEARGAFEEVLEVTLPADDLHIRAILELGHLDRRQRLWAHAIVRYQQAVGCKKASLRFRNDAREWLVKVHLATMAWQSAEAVAQQWLAVCEGPVEETKILDLQIRAKIGARQLRRADQMLQELRARMAVLAAAPTGEGARVQRALEQMKAPAALELARQNGR